MSIELIIDIIATILGFLSIGFLFNLNKKLGGKMSQALYLFIGGIIFMALAFIWTIAFGHGDFMTALHGGHQAVDMAGIAAEPSVDVHHILMAAGMIFFIFSARKFSSLIKND